MLHSVLGYFLSLMLLVLGATSSLALVKYHAPHPSTLYTASLSRTFTQYYDPEVEFLEVGVSLNGKTTWKLYGPDASGTYGGMGGVGGLDAIAPPPDLFCPLLSDIRGNVQAIYDQRHQSLTWNKSRVTGYGAAPGCRLARLVAPFGFFYQIF